jgi:Ni/Co efflux regulator RcnB
MKRLMLTLTAIVAVLLAAGPLPGDSAAAAKDGRGGRWEQRVEREARVYQVQGRGQERGRGRGQGRGQGRGGEWRDGPRRDYEPRREYEGGREYGPPARRGGYMPPDYRGGVVQDYGRYRLRPPPRGYSWVRVGGGYALVSIMTGQVFDVVPD